MFEIHIKNIQSFTRVHFKHHIADINTGEFEGLCISSRSVIYYQDCAEV